MCLAFLGVAAVSLRLAVGARLFNVNYRLRFSPIFLPALCADPFGSGSTTFPARPPKCYSASDKEKIHMPEKSLAGQVALVTGAAKRIGRSIALRLAAEGADVTISYDSSKSEAEQLVEELKASGRRALAVQADVSHRADVQKLFSAAENEFARLDILVNNAGMFSSAKFEELTEEQWDHIMNVNLKSQFLCAQSAAPIMKRQGRGRIINLSSLGGLLPWPAFTHYCVSKAGCIMLTRCLARALGPEILVNSIAPGTIQFPGEAPDEDYIQRVPLHRTGTGEDIADAVAFLAKSDFVTGQILAVDGGRSLV
jgi:NAD(P)-dependent dehydrogenase (short-subunit alcohol dehydrogenase family)